MSDNTSIEWAVHPETGKGASWNPVRARHHVTGKVGWHCTHVSPGCINCYAEGINKRLGTGLPYKLGHEKDIEVFLDEKTLLQPLRWKASRGIFVGSMTDLFGDFVTDTMLDRIFAVMALCPQHVFMALTKRSARMRAYCENHGIYPRVIRIGEAARSLALKAGVPVTEWPWPLPHVWCGVSVEDQQRADERRDDLRTLAEQGWTTFCSYEPALERVDWSGWEFLRWLICGGESGPNARPMHHDSPRGARDWSAAHGVPYFFKQHGEWIGVADLRHIPGGRGPGFGAYDHCQYDMEHEAVRVGKTRAGRLLEGREHNEMPEARRS